MVKASDIFTPDELAHILKLKTLFNGKVIRIETKRENEVDKEVRETDKRK